MPGAPELPGGKSSGAAAAAGAKHTTEVEHKPQLLHSTKPAVSDEEIDETDDALEEDELNEHVQEPADPDGVLAEEEHKRWLAEHPLPKVAQKKPRRKGPLIVVAVIIALLFAAGAFYWFGVRKAAAPAPSTQSQTTQQSSKQTEQTAEKQTKHYDSTQHTLSIDYPSDWVLSDTDEAFTLTSSPYDFTDATGAKARGKLVFSIQDQQSAIPGYPANGATAVLDSDKLAYKKPSASQRAETYLSYLGYQNTTGLDSLFITGDNGYKTDQQVPQTDLTGMNTLVSTKFLKCENQACTNPTAALSVQASSWKASTAAKDVQAAIESLVFN